MIVKEFADIEEKIVNGVRLDNADVLRLLMSDNILEIGHLANIVREKLNSNKTHYIINRHINYSNICVNSCKFCAFSKKYGDNGAYTYTLEEIFKIAETIRGTPVTEFHIVGGIHPDLSIDYYIEMISGLSKSFPDVHIQAFTAVEIAHIAKIAGLGIEETLIKLKEAGLGSIPGGGAEVFDEALRAKVCPEKLPSKDWLDVSRKIHKLGLRSNATMLYGFIETPEQVVDHLMRLRDLQDETSGFLSFIPLLYHPENTRLGKCKESSCIYDLKIYAVSRLYLDNFSHIKAFWIMIGLKIAEILQYFGVDDIDGTVVEEKITHSAGARTPEMLSVDDIKHLIKSAGRTPVQRDTLYNYIKVG